MFTITSLPNADGVSNKVYKFTFFDSYMICESLDGSKAIHRLTQPTLACQIDKTESPARELILLPGNGMSGTIWFRFPIGTFNKILENVYNFKGENLLDLLN
jgi:hypothetical protein